MDLVLLFDLDGTLTDSREGIVKSVRYALEKLSLPIPPEETLLRFIGPPLEDSFQSCCGLTEAGAAEGCRLALASSKPEHLCEKVCARFGFAESLEVIAGSQPGAGMTKADVIRLAMERLGLTEAEKRRTVMIGDRKFDVEGAAECGLPCVGVEFFGYAGPGELQAAGAAAVVRTAAELDQYLRSL